MTRWRAALALRLAPRFKLWRLGFSVEGGIGLAIASAVQPVAAGLAAGGRQWAGAAHFGEGCLRADALRIIADKDQHLSCRTRCDAGRCNELRGMGCGQHVQVAVVCLYLLAQR